MAKKKRIRQGLPFSTLQLNVEGLAASKLDIVKRLAIQHDVTIIFLQETHCQTVRKLVVNNYELAGYTISRRHGLAIFVRNNLSWKLSNSIEDLDIEWQCINVESFNIVNTCKPPPSKMTLALLLFLILPASMEVISIVNILTGGRITSALIESV